MAPDPPKKSYSFPRGTHQRETSASVAAAEHNLPILESTPLKISATRRDPTTPAFNLRHFVSLGCKFVGARGHWTGWAAGVTPPER